jgi:hypothetical protein
MGACLRPIHLVVVVALSLWLAPTAAAQLRFTAPTSTALNEFARDIVVAEELLALAPPRGPLGEPGGRRRARG